MNKKIYIAGTFVIIAVLVLVTYKHIHYSSILKEQLYIDAKSLIADAKSRYKYVSEGGNNPVISQDDLSKMLIVDSTINTKGKLMEFLQKTYTNNASKKIYKDLGYKEINGKLYKAIADSVFLYDWNKASIKDIKINLLNKNATVIFDVLNFMVGDKDIVEFKLIKSADNTYKIDKRIGGW